MAVLQERRAGRTRLLPELAAVVAAGWALYALLEAVQGGEGSVLAFSSLLDRAGDRVWDRLLWFIADTTEAQFYASVLGGVTLLAGAILAHRLQRRGVRWAGFELAAGTGLFPAMLAASLLGLAISVIAYGGILRDGAWIPTFVPFVSIPAGIVLVYGGHWRTILTGAVLGGAIGFPIAYAVIKWVLEPTGYPAVIGNVTGMWLGGIIAFELCHRVLPWMRGRGAPAPDEPSGQPAEPEDAPPAPMDRPGWLARRTLADFTEAPFFGNELASAALLLGVCVSWMLDAGEPIYGSGLLPAVIAGQVMASALGIVLYDAQWRRLEWYPTFIPVVSVTPAVILTFGGGPAKIFAGAILGALLGPPLAQLGIERLPGHWHPYVANTFAMAVTTAIVITVLRVLPGFDLPG